MDDHGLSCHIVVSTKHCKSFVVGISRDISGKLKMTNHTL